jgi:hypothetical protein
MSSENRIKRHGRDLMSLASVGMFCVVVVGLALMFLPYAARAPDSAFWAEVSGITWARVVQMTFAGKIFFILTYMVWVLANLLPLIALRHLGSSLYRNEALNVRIAAAFVWLARSVVAYLLLPTVLPLCVKLYAMVGGGAQAAADIMQYKMPGRSLSAIYIAIVACICLYSVAHLMKLAAATADDARSIV